MYIKEMGNIIDILNNFLQPQLVSVTTYVYVTAEQLPSDF